MPHRADSSPGRLIPELCSPWPHCPPQEPKQGNPKTQQCPPTLTSCLEEVPGSATPLAQSVKGSKRCFKVLEVWSAWEVTAPIKIIRGSLQALIVDFLMNSVCYCCIIKNLTGLCPWLLVGRLPPWNFLVYRSVCYSWAPWITPEFTLRDKVTEHRGCPPETPTLWLEGWGTASPTAGWGVLTGDWAQSHGQCLTHSCLCN